MHWMKNIFVILPVFFGGAILNTTQAIAAALTFMSFSLAASAIYCLNDIIDVDADRAHDIVALSASLPSASPSVCAGTKYVVTVCVFSVIILPELIFCCTFVHQTVIMTPLYPRLLALRDRQYAEFQARLVPGVAPDSIIGIRVPLLRAFAKDFAREADCSRFLSLLPHRYYDENMLHALLLSQLKDMDECVARVEEFLPYVDNWAVCDI